jgi:hypothetical protein
MSRASTIILAAALAAGGAVFYLTRPAHAPAGQPPLVEISGQSLGALKTEFNRASSTLRIILLLSPT